MAELRSLPDKFYDKDYETNSMRRVRCGVSAALR